MGHTHETHHMVRVEEIIIRVHTNVYPVFGTPRQNASRKGRLHHVETTLRLRGKDQRGPVQPVPDVRGRCQYGWKIKR